LPGIEEAVFRDFWGYLFIKDGENFLIEASDEKGEKLDIKSLLPIEGRDLEEVADTKGNVYYLVRRPVPKVIVGERKHSVKEFVDNMTLLKHSNPSHQKLLMMMGLSQLWDRSNYRVASVKGAGKDNTVDSCMDLYGGCCTIESPTIAKLEERATVLKWLAVNEIVSLSNDAWEIIQQFLLKAGAHKNTITKRSRAFGIVGETIDISKFSISLFFNDIDHYPKMEEYFDYVTSDQVKDRFPAFRLYGGYVEDFNSMKGINIEEFVKVNLSWYVDMVKSFVFYKANINNCLHNWNQTRFMKHEGRDKTNMSKLINIIDAYSESQAEFDSWADIVNDAMMDYHEMLSYPHLEKAVIDKIGAEAWHQDKKDEKGKIIKLSEKNIVKNIKTFKEKHQYMRRLIKGETLIEQKDTPWNWEKEII